MIFKSIFKGLFVFCVIASVTTWAAWIFAATLSAAVDDGTPE